MERARQAIRKFKAQIGSSLCAGLVIFLASCALTPSAHAQANPGTYRCVRVEAAGQSSRCQSPSLILNSDGSYQIWGENGTYEVVEDRWLVLSHSKRRGLGDIQKPGEIVFEYRVGKQICRVYFEKEFEPTGGFEAS